MGEKLKLKMITERDLKMAYHKDTGREWKNISEDVGAFMLQHEWVVERLLKYENILLKAMNR